MSNRATVDAGRQLHIRCRVPNLEACIPFPSAARFVNFPPLSPASAGAKANHEDASRRSGRIA
jgi:hypothetical protein